MGTKHNQRGTAPLLLVLALLIIAVAGFAGWCAWHNQDSKTSTAGVIDPHVADAIADAQCDYSDKDLCKFYAGYQAQPYYTVTSTHEQDDKKTTTIIKVDGKTKYALTVDKPTPSQLIVIGSDAYTKAADGTWYKQPVSNDQTAQYRAANLQLKAPGANDAAVKQQYQRLSKEACGKLTCFKYQFTDPADGKTTTYLWFDDTEYQLRHAQTVTNSGTYDATYAYDKVSVATPTPVKDREPDQSAMPGQNQADTSLPATGDDVTEAELQQLLQQYPVQ